MNVRSIQASQAHVKLSIQKINKTLHFIQQNQYFLNYTQSSCF